MVVVLIFVAYFYGVGNPPKVEHAIFDTTKACVAEGHAATARAEASPKVQGTQFVCVVSRPVDKI